MNINATVNTSFIAILTVNVKNSSKLIDVKVQVNTLNCTISSNYHTEMVGLKIIVYYYDRISESGSLTINNFHYNNHKPCVKHFLCIIDTVFLQNEYDTENIFS